MAIVTKVSVRVSGRIPTQAYGWIEIEQTWEADLAPDDNPDQVSTDLYDHAHIALVEAVKPVLKLKIKGMEAALSNFDKETQDKLRNDLGPAIWIAANMPEIATGASETRLKSTLENLKNTSLDFDQPA